MEKTEITYVQDSCTGLITDPEGRTVSLITSEAELRFEQLSAGGRRDGRAGS